MRAALLFETDPFPGLPRPAAGLAEPKVDRKLGGLIYLSLLPEACPVQVVIAVVVQLLQFLRGQLGQLELAAQLLVRGLGTGGRPPISR